MRRSGTRAVHRQHQDPAGLCLGESSPTGKPVANGSCRCILSGTCGSPYQRGIATLSIPRIPLLRRTVLTSNAITNFGSPEMTKSAAESHEWPSSSTTKAVGKTGIVNRQTFNGELGSRFGYRSPTSSSCLRWVGSAVPKSQMILGHANSLQFC